MLVILSFLTVLVVQGLAFTPVYANSTTQTATSSSSSGVDVKSIPPEQAVKAAQKVGGEVVKISEGVATPAAAFGLFIGGFFLILGIFSKVFLKLAGVTIFISLGVLFLMGGITDVMGILQGIVDMIRSSFRT